MPNFDPGDLVMRALAVATLFRARTSVPPAGSALLHSRRAAMCLPVFASMRDPAWAFVPSNAAIADTLKHRLTRVVAIVAVTANGEIIPPCGRCRELIRQIDPANWETMVVVVSPSSFAKLADLLPQSNPVGNP